MPDNGSANNNDFDKLWDYNNPAATEIKFRELIPELKSLKDQSHYLQLLTQVSRSLGLQMKFDDAHKQLDEVLNLLTEEYPVANIRYLLERGRTFRSSKQVDKSREFFLKAYELALKVKEDDLAIDAAHMMGIIEPFEEAQRWNELAMKISELSEDKKANNWLGSLYNNTAWNYHDNKDFEKALNLFEKNVIWHTNKNSVQQLIIAKWSVARTLRSLNRIDEAIESQLNLINEIEDKGLEQDGYVFEELGELYLLKENKAESEKYFRLGYDLLSKDIWLAENEKERLARMNMLGGKI